VAEGLKLRNLLAEFLPQGLATQPQPQFTIVGPPVPQQLGVGSGEQKQELVAADRGAFRSNERLLEEFRKGGQGSCGSGGLLAE